MEYNKDIGKYFKETLNNLDKNPNDFGWNAIENELDKNKKRGFFYFQNWAKFAVFLCIGILIGGLFINNSSNKNDAIIENNVPNKTKFDSEKVIVNSSKSIENEIKKENEETYLKDKNAVSNIKEVNAIASNSNENINKITKNNGKFIKNAVKKDLKVSVSNNKKYKNKNNKNLTVNLDNLANTNHENKSNISNNTLNNSNLYQNNESFENKSINNSNAINNQNLISDFREKYIESNSKTPLEMAVNIIFGNSNICLDETEMQKMRESFKKDSIQNINLKNTQLSKIETDTIKKEKEKEIVCEVFAFVTPVFPLFISDNSTIDNRLDNNPKTTKTTFGFGGYLCFQANEKFSLRVGFKNTSFKFITENVLINTTDYSNIEYSSNYSNSVIYNLSNHENKMTVTQNLSYNEIPIEAKISMFKFRKNTKINGIVGFEYLFLDKNSVDITTSNLSLFHIGQTKDLLKQTFGINIGFGLEYKLSKKIKFNFEPMFNYHISNIQDNSKMNYFSMNILTGLQFGF